MNTTEIFDYKVKDEVELKKSQKDFKWLNTVEVYDIDLQNPFNVK